MKILWVMNPWEAEYIPFDTTPRLIFESFELGHTNSWCSFREITLGSNHVYANGFKIEAIQPNSENVLTQESFKLSSKAMVPIDQFDIIVYRTDPPVDLGYLHPLQILKAAQLKNPKLKILNPIEALTTFNEKFLGTVLPDFFPDSFVGSQKEALLKFARTHQKVILKPLHLCQSIGIEMLSFDTPTSEIRSIDLLESTSQNFTQPILLQEYLPGIHQGETRLWFLNGELLINAKKMPKQGEFKIDMDRGGTVHTATLTPGEKHVSNQIGHFLKEHKICMAAVDLIDEKITDFNITSPGVLTLIERIYKRNFSKLVIEGMIKTLS